MEKISDGGLLKKIESFFDRLFEVNNMEEHKKRLDIMRKEEELHLKSKEELETLQTTLRRRIRHMENYDWEVVQDSSKENKEGFCKEIDFLECLLEAVSLELSQRT